MPAAKAFTEHRRTRVVELVTSGMSYASGISPRSLRIEPSGRRDCSSHWSGDARARADLQRLKNLCEDDAS